MDLPAAEADFPAGAVVRAADFVAMDFLAAVADFAPVDDWARAEDFAAAAEGLAGAEGLAAAEGPAEGAERADFFAAVGGCFFFNCLATKRPLLSSGSVRS
jgi:hypothetical protein